MYITHLDINNYHCFQKASFDFGKEVTILFGKNGTGKSSLLKALCDAMSFIFSNSETASGYKSLVGDVPNLRVSNISSREIYHTNKGEVATAVDIIATANYSGENLTWHYKKNSSSAAKVQNSLFRDAYVSFMRKYKECDELPILSYYSDRYPLITNDKIAKEYIEKDDVLARSWGYYQWDDFASSTELWRKRFIRVCNLYLRLQQSLEHTIPEGKAKIEKSVSELKREKDYIVNFLRKFTDNSISKLSDLSEDIKIADLIVDGVDEPYLKCIFADGMQRRWEDLPAGYERLFSIVLDIAYRSYILNSGNTEPSGIVIIDEVDLHLHPNLQQDVVLRFKSTFPKIQFIIATHSPIVLSNFQQDDQNIIIKMLREGEEYSHVKVVDMYGFSYDSAIGMMDTEPRNSY